MSYIKHKENVFKQRGNGLYRRRSTPQLLNNATLCSDARSWSLDPQETRDFILETIQNSNISSEGRFVPPGVIIDLLKPKNGTSSNPVQCRRSKSASTLTDKLVDEEQNENSKNEIKSLNYEQDGLNTETLCSQSGQEYVNNLEKLQSNDLEEYEKKRLELQEGEVLNLKNLVNDLREQVLYLENCKKENIRLRSELQTDILHQLAESKAENNHLSTELEAYVDIVERYKIIRDNNSSLQDQCKQLQRKLKSVEGDKLKLNEELKDRAFQLEIYQAKKNDVSTVICERNFLIDRVQEQREKIDFLRSIITEQEEKIVFLTLKVQKLSTSVTKKEERLEKRMDDFRHLCEQQSEKLMAFEYKLESSDILNRELQSLKNQLKINNSALKCQVDFYKAQFRKVTGFGLQMASRIKELNNELSCKELKLKRFSSFPQSGKTVIYFAQLNTLLRNENILNEEDPERIKDLIKSLRKIVSQLKIDTWEKQNSLPFDTEESAVQTQIDVKNAEAQVKIIISDKVVQVQFPDEMAFRYQNSQLIVKDLSEQVNALKNACHLEQERKSYFEEQLLNVLEEKEKQEKEVGSLRSEVESLKQTVTSLSFGLKEKDTLIGEVIQELELTASIHCSCEDLHNASFSNMIVEYEKYVEVLKTQIEIEEGREDHLKKIVSSEIWRMKENEDEKSMEKYELLNSLKYEKELNSHLSLQVLGLEKELKFKEQEIKVTEKKLEEIEILVYDFEKTISETDVIGEPNLVAMFASQDTKNKNERRLGMISQLLVSQNKALEKTLECRSMLERKLKYMVSTNNILKKLIKNNKLQNKGLRQKVLQLTSSIKRVKKFVLRMRNALNISEEINYNFQILNSSLNKELENLRVDNGFMTKDIDNLRLKITNLEYGLKAKDTEIVQQIGEKEKMEKLLAKIMKRLEKYRLICEKEVNHKLTSTEDLPDLWESFQKYAVNVKELELKNMEFQNVIKKLEDMAAHDEPKRDHRNVETQVDVNKCELEAYQEIIVELKNNLQEEVIRLKNEHCKELELADKRYINNLSFLRDTYERDIKRIKKAHKDNLEKMQALHEEEISTCKKISEEGVSKNTELEVDLVSLEEKHRREIELITLEFKKKLEEQEVSFKQRENEIIEKSRKLIAEKESELKNKYEKCVSTVNNFKQKCKDYIKNSHDIHKKNMKKFKESFAEKFEKTRLIEIQKNKLKSLGVTNTEQYDIGLLPAEKESDEESYSDNYKLKTEFTSSETKDLILEKYGDANGMSHDPYRFFSKGIDYFDNNYFGNLMELIPTKGLDNYEKIMFDNSVNKFSLYYQSTNHVMQLENELILKAEESNRMNFKLQKRIQEEYNRNIELSSLLDCELKHSIEIQRRLGLEFQRVEQSERDKESLRRQISMLEKKLQQYNDNVEMERAKSFALKLELEKVLLQQKHANQLESSISRLRTRLEKSMDSEKQLIKELERERSQRAKFEALYRMSTLNKAGNKKQSQVSDLRVIFIQQCGILHTWGRKVVQKELEGRVPE